MSNETKSGGPSVGTLLLERLPSLQDKMRRKKFWLVFSILAATLLYQGMEMLSYYEHAKFAQSLGGEVVLKPTGWLYFMSPCSSWDGCRIEHGTYVDDIHCSSCVGMFSLPRYGMRFEEYSFLWFKKRRYLTPIIRSEQDSLNQPVEETSSTPSRGQVKSP